MISLFCVFFFFFSLPGVYQIYWCFQRISSLFWFFFSFFFSVFKFINLCLCLYLLPSACFGFMLLLSRFLRWDIGLLIWDSFSFQICASSAINFPLSTILGSAQTKGKITQVILHFNSLVEQWFGRRWLKPVWLTIRSEYWLHFWEVSGKLLSISKPCHLYNGAYALPISELNDKIHLKNV